MAVVGRHQQRPDAALIDTVYIRVLFNESLRCLQIAHLRRCMQRTCHDRAIYVKPKISRYSVGSNRGMGNGSVKTLGYH